MKSTKIKLLIILLYIGFLMAQTINSRDLELNDNDKLIKLTESFILESQIDINSYFLGPGDKIGLSIISNVNLTYIITISPTGHLWIPDIGTLVVAGLNISNCEKKIKEYFKKNKYNSAEVKVVLMNLRKFKIQVKGAVHNPGFVSIVALSRLSDAIHKSGGLHKYSNEMITIKSKNGYEKKYSLQKYEINGDLINNPVIKEGDVIDAHYDKNYFNILNDVTTHKRIPVMVTGHVFKPNSHKFIPGYSIVDYIALSGGISDMGSLNRVTVIRNGNKIISNKINIKPGDQIHIPANLKYKFLGNISILQTFTAIMTICLAFLATQ